jgi:hypothetical protein
VICLTSFSLWLSPSNTGAKGTASTFRKLFLWHNFPLESWGTKDFFNCLTKITDPRHLPSVLGPGFYSLPHTSALQALDTSLRQNLSVKTNRIDLEHHCQNQSSTLLPLYLKSKPLSTIVYPHLRSRQETRRAKAAPDSRPPADFFFLTLEQLP